MRTVTPDPSDFPARIRVATPPHNVRPWPLPVCESTKVDEWRAQLTACADQGECDAREAEIASELEASGTPIWEKDAAGSARVTFISIQDAPHGVALQLNRLTDPIDVSDTVMTRLGGSRVHALTLRVPHDWLGSYLFVPLPEPPTLVLHRGVDLETVRPMMIAAHSDPYAREHIHNKLMTSAESAAPRLAVARAPQAPTTALWRDPAPETHRLDPVNSPANATALPLSVWSHPDADDGSPVVLLTDGEVWRKQQPIAAELSRRVSDGECGPMHVVFFESAGSSQRQLDYAATREESSRLLDSIRAHAADRVGNGQWVVAGQSLGGLFAMLCATRHPDRIAAGVAQSPSLWWPATPPEQHMTGWFEERAATDAGSPILLEGGIFDWLLTARTRDAAALLRAQHALIDYREQPAGHDIAQWQATLPGAITHTITYLAKG